MGDCRLLMPGLCVRVLQVLRLFWSDVFDEVAIAVAASGDGVADGSGDCRIRLLDEASFAPITELIGHKAPIITMVPNPSGEVFASLGIDEQVRLWNCFKSPEVAKVRCRRHRKSSFLSAMERFR